MKIIKGLCCIALLLSSVTLSYADQTYGTHPEVKRFIKSMVKKHNFQEQKLTELFATAKHKDSIIKAITRPAESKPWFDYRPIFVTNDRAKDGAEFWKEHKAVLQRAEKKYGVPAHIIVAIIGVESKYGRNTGGYRVIDALSTLAFDYPPRSKFFKKELEHFLLLTRDEKLDPLSINGSYAGAIGMPQFMPSSYRSYAVDFSNTGNRDLQNNVDDVIGSIANYFKRHGWEKEHAIVSQATVSKKVLAKIDTNKLKPNYTLNQLAALGISPKDNNTTEKRAAVIKLEQKDGQEYWLGYNNFYVITRYNISSLYAMAVVQLSDKIKAYYQDSTG